MSGLETERKFLVGQLPPGIEQAPSSEIVQGYLVIDADGGEVRIRRRAGRATLTVKQGRGLTRQEVEIELAADAFDRLWPLTEGRRVEKTRHVLDDLIELDVYGGALSGLVVAEVEFSDEANARAFDAPDWFGSEVTEDDAYKNQRLAVDGLPRALDSS